MKLDECIKELNHRGMTFKADYLWFEKTIGRKPMSVDVCVYVNRDAWGDIKEADDIEVRPVWQVTVYVGSSDEKRWSHLCFQDVLNLLDGKMGNLMPDWMKKIPAEKGADAILEGLTKDGFMTTINWHADSKTFVVAVPGSYHQAEGATLLEALEKLESAVHDDMQKISDFLVSHGWVKQEDVSCHWVKYLHGPYGNTLTLNLMREGIHWMCECISPDRTEDKIGGNSAEEVLDTLCDRMRYGESNIMLYLTEKKEMKK